MLGPVDTFTQGTEIWSAFEQCIIAEPPFIPAGEYEFDQQVVWQWHAIDPAPPGAISPFVSHELDLDGSFNFRYRGSNSGGGGIQQTAFTDSAYQYGASKIYRYVTRLVIDPDGAGSWEVWRRAPGESSGTKIVDVQNATIGFTGDTFPYPKTGGSYRTRMTNVIRVGYRPLAAYGAADLSAFI